MTQSDGSRWVSTHEGRHLAGRRRTDTKPEIALRKALHAAGFRFRIHTSLAKGCTPDIVLPRWRTVVFVDGCFWHGCPVHGRQRPWTGPNAALWQEKMAANQRRDITATRLAEDLGWKVERVWECEVRADAALCVEQIRERLTERQPPGQLGKPSRQDC